MRSVRSIVNFEDAKLLDHPLVVKAFALAKKGHHGQVRGTSASREKPYLNHPVKVAELLEDAIENYDPVLIAAGLAHDLLEDTAITEDEIREELGEDVLSLVKEVSFDNSLKGAARRDFQIASIAQSSPNAQRLKVADRLTNLMSMSFDPPENWSVANRYNYLRASQEMIDQANISDPKLLSMVGQVMEVAERSVFVAIRERLRDKGQSKKHWRDFDPGIEDYIKRAEDDLVLQDVLFDADRKPWQRYGSLDRLYSEATLAQVELGNTARTISEWMKGVEAVVPDKLKERDRSEEVITTRCDGDPRGLYDVARVALVCDTLEQARYVAHAVSQSYSIAELKDSMANPPMSAYRDIHIVTRSDRSHFCEIQIHLRHLWDAKKYRGDAIYQEIRDICSKDELTPEEKKRKRKLFDESRALYKEAAEKHGFTDHKPVQGYKPLRPEGMKLPPEIIGEDMIEQEKSRASDDFPSIRAG